MKCLVYFNDFDWFFYNKPNSTSKRSSQFYYFLKFLTKSFEMLIESTNFKNRINWKHFHFDLFFSCLIFLIEETHPSSIFQFHSVVFIDPHPVPLHLKKAKWFINLKPSVVALFLLLIQTNKRREKVQHLQNHAVEMKWTPAFLLIVVSMGLALSARPTSISRNMW